MLTNFFFFLNHRCKHLLKPKDNHIWQFDWKIYIPLTINIKCTIELERINCFLSICPSHCRDLCNLIDIHDISVNTKFINCRKSKKIKQLKRNMVCKYKFVLMYNKYNLYFDSFTKEYSLILFSLNLTRTRIFLTLIGKWIDRSSQ